MYSPRTSDQTIKHCCEGCGRPLTVEIPGLVIGLTEFVVDGEVIPAWRRVCDLLRILAQTPNETVHREIIYGRMWSGDADVFDKSIDVFAYRLRQSLVGTRFTVFGERGVGHRLVVTSKEQHDARIKDLRGNRKRAAHQRIAGHSPVAARRQGRSTEAGRSAAGQPAAV
jgi:DNA-binding winged helix-turn-helix (wHTH) protein